MRKKKHWYDYLWIASTVYLAWGEHRLRSLLGSTVCFWFLRSYAYIYSAGLADDDFVQTQVLMCLLPYGNDDPGNLPNKTQGGSIKWKTKQNRLLNC